MPALPHHLTLPCLLAWTCPGSTGPAPGWFIFCLGFSHILDMLQKHFLLLNNHNSFAGPCLPSTFPHTALPRALLHTATHARRALIPAHPTPYHIYHATPHAFSIYILLSPRVATSICAVLRRKHSPPDGGSGRGCGGAFARAGGRFGAGAARTPLRCIRRARDTYTAAAAPRHAAFVRAPLPPRARTATLPRCHAARRR